MNVIILLIVVYFYGVGNKPQAGTRVEASPEMCLVDAAVYKDKLEKQDKVQGVYAKCIAGGAPEVTKS